MIKPLMAWLACVMALSASAFSQPVTLVRAPMEAPTTGIVHLGAGPYTFDTAEQHALRVTVIARLPHPFGLAFLPNGDALVIERSAGLRMIHDIAGTQPRLDPQPILGVPATIQDVALHPHFETNRLVYFSYTKSTATEPPAAGELPPAAGVVARGKFDGKSLTDVHDILAGKVGNLVALRRLMFAPDGMLYVTSGAPYSMEAQDLGSIYGKVLRLRDDGSAPPDNPFASKPGARPEIYALGLRDQLGIAYHAASGQILTADHGPNGGDRVNAIRRGGDYGWPKYSFGRQYNGPRISDLPTAAGIEQPLVLWNPSVAPSGLEIYTGLKFPAWQGNLFVGSARRGGINGTGGLERVVLNAKLEELRRESLLADLHLRVRFVKQGPDGLLYVLVEGTGFGPDQDGALLRLEPAPQS